ncbi:hypothetical protein MMC28_007529 [Mycoblastus sanguinarius]|nr:hypothetical protein [Mycoblastus sanguinarius]
MPTDPFSAIAAGINTSIKIFEITYQLKAVDEQTCDLLSTTRHVILNVNEARRLRRLKDALLNSGERAWMDGVIEDTENALSAIAQLIEPARVDKTTKQGINLGHKFMWVFRDSPKVRDKHARLHMCHQSLTTVISSLYSKDVVVIAPVTEQKREEDPPPYDPQLEELFNWHNHRKQRKSFLSIREHPVGSPISTSSGSTSTAVTSPTMLPLMESDEQPSNIRPSNPDSRFSSSARALLEPEATPATFRSNNPYFNSTSNLPEFDKSSQNTSTSHPYPDRDTSYINTAVSTTTPTYRPYRPPSSLPEVDPRPFNTKTNPHPMYGNSDGLQVCGSNDPFPPLDQQPQFCTSDLNISAWSPFNAGATSLSRRSYSTGQVPAYNPPSFPTHYSYDQPGSVAQSQLGGLETTVSGAYVGTQETEPAQPGLIENDKELESEVGRSLSLGQGSMRRAGRSWLAYYATRSDMGHYTG